MGAVPVNIESVSAEEKSQDGSVHRGQPAPTAGPSQAVTARPRKVEDGAKLGHFRRRESADTGADPVHSGDPSRPEPSGISLGTASHSARLE